MNLYVSNLKLTNFIYLGITGVLLLFVCHPIFGPDIWYHLAWGRRILDASEYIPKLPVLLGGNLIANQYWLYQVVMSALFDIGGPLGITIFYMIIWLGIVFFWLKSSGLWRKPLAGPIVFLLFVFVARVRTEYRPEHISLLFLAFFIWRLSQPNLSRREMIQLLIVEIIWANIHSYFVLGPCITVLAAMLRPNRRMFALVPLLAAVTLINPAGIFLYQSIYVLGVTNKVLAGRITEMTPLYHFSLLGQGSMIWSLIGITTVSALLSLFKRAHFFAALLGLAGVFLAISALRFGLTFLILSGPILGVFASWIDDRWNGNRTLVGAANWSVGLTLCFTAWLLVSGRFFYHVEGFGVGIGIDPATYPVQAVEYLKEIGFTGKVYNSDFDGSYLEYFLPRATITCDSSYISGETTLKYFDSMSDTSKLVRMDSEFHFDALLLRAEDLGMVASLLSSQRWVTAYSDLYRILFLRKSHFANFARPLSSGIYYRGEDLRRYGYSNIPAIWATYARRQKDPRLMETLFDQFSQASALPSDFVAIALETAQTSHDATVTKVALDMYGKMFRFGNDEGVDKLAAELKADPLSSLIPARSEVVDPAIEANPLLKLAPKKAAN